jgi:hypothetical protein
MKKKLKKKQLLPVLKKINSWQVLFLSLLKTIPHLNRTLFSGMRVYLELSEVVAKWKRSRKPNVSVTSCVVI